MIHVLHQPVPVWTAYNSLLRTSASNTESIKVDKLLALPLINSPAHEWTTLTTALTQLCNLNKLSAQDNQENEPILAWLDMDLYKRVQKLNFLDLQFKANIIPSPGPFHIVLYALRCLGATLENSSIDEAWSEADLYSSFTVEQILNGKHNNRALNTCQITLQVLVDLWIEAFREQHPMILNKLISALENVRTSCQKGLDIAQAHHELASYYILRYINKWSRY